MKNTLCTNRASKYGEPLTRPGHLSQKATNTVHTFTLILTTAVSLQWQYTKLHSVC